MDGVIPTGWQWFNEARFGLFIHFGPYAPLGRGEQVLFRELRDQKQYIRQACRWNPKRFDADAIIRLASEAGMKYAVLTTRHHDGYCLWDSRLTDYTSAAQAPKRDMVREYVEACRRHGLRVGLYYSLTDWRIPACWQAEADDPQAWAVFRDYVHGQVRELLTHYGKIDLVWFDGAWPHSAAAWKSRELVAMMRGLQPEILINNRLDCANSVDGISPVLKSGGQASLGPEAAGESAELGDFGTPEHHITAESGRLWESCNTSTWRLWGYAKGELWRTPEQMLDMLVNAAGQGGNLLLNLGPDGQGRVPAKFVAAMKKIGQWMEVNGQAIYGSQGTPYGVCEFVTHGWQVRKGNDLYLVLRFWHGDGQVRMMGLKTKVLQAQLLGSDASLSIRQDDHSLTIHGLPKRKPGVLFPVIRLVCDGQPESESWAKQGLWNGDPRRMRFWVPQDQTVWVDGASKRG